MRQAAAHRDHRWPLAGRVPAACALRVLRLRGLRTGQFPPPGQPHRRAVHLGVGVVAVSRPVCRQLCHQFFGQRLPPVFAQTQQERGTDVRISFCFQKCVDFGRRNSKQRNPLNQRRAQRLIGVISTQHVSKSGSISQHHLEQNRIARAILRCQSVLLSRLAAIRRGVLLGRPLLHRHLAHLRECNGCFGNQGRRQAIELRSVPGMVDQNSRQPRGVVSQKPRKPERGHVRPLAVIRVFPSQPREVLF